MGSASPKMMPSPSLTRPETHCTENSIFPEKSPPSPPRTRSRLTTSLSTGVNPAYGALLLLVCCLITGLLDSTLFHAYGTFVSGQTGNTILFGLGASTAHITTRPYRWAKSLIAIISFASGCTCFSHSMRVLGRLKRGTLVLSFVMQAAVVLLVGIIVQADGVEGRLSKINDDIDWRQCLPIALLSFQSAGQICASRALRINEIPTVVLTSMIHDIAADPKILSPWRENTKRNQMLGAFAATLLGALAGGFISISTGKMQSTLWVVGVLKLGIASAWMMWPAEDQGEGV